MKIGIIQENFLVADFEGNAKKIESQILKIGAGADFFVTPEMSLWGYPPQDLLLLEEYIEESQLVLERLCQRLKDYCFLVGLAVKKKQAKAKITQGLYNAVALCQDGKVKKYFYKCLLPNYDVFDEKRYFEAGEFCEYFEWQGKKIGVCICEDLCYSKEYNLVKNYSGKHLLHLKEHKLDFILNPSCSPYSKGKIKHRQHFLKKISQEFGCPVVFVNQVGGQDSLIFDGSSFVVASEKMASKKIPKVDYTISLASFQNESLLFSAEQSPKNQLPSKPIELELCDALILGLKDYFHKTGFQKAVLGLSGGIDSALTLFLAVEAFGKNNVLAILLPSPYSSEHSVKDALELTEKLGIKTHAIKIEKIMHSYDEALDGVFGKTTQKDETEENIQTRIRGSLLMAVANKNNQLLLTTGNKSETFSGYCTLYGDMCGALNPLGDLKKMEIYAICKEINKTREIFSASILNKEPSAELKPNQTDQDKLPPYKELDEVLERVVIGGERNKKLEKEFSKELVRKSLRMFQLAEFKRKQAAPILRVSEKAFGGAGWRMPLARKLR